jgi:hypothetical protein
LKLIRRRRSLLDVTPTFLRAKEAARDQLLAEIQAIGERLRDVEGFVRRLGT